MNKTRLNIAKKDIISEFENQPIKIFRRSDIDQIISNNRDFWRLAQSTTRAIFINFLLKETPMKKIRFDFPYRPEIRYTWGDRNLYKILLSIKDRSYFSHYTAVHFHQFTEQIPKTIYVNHEQPDKGSSGSGLAQERIDRAFKNKPRTTNYIANIGKQKVCLLNGKFTDKLGVIEMQLPENISIQITNIERTLIDITVRPWYAGGISEVLNAYKQASGTVSINKMASYLKQINYIYPYHQAIGFYLEKSGVYKPSQIEILRKIKMDYDFYLTYQMEKTQYSKKWRLFYPKGF